MTDDVEPVPYVQLQRRLSLEMYAEGLGVVRGLQDGSLRLSPRPFRSIADAAEYAVIGARARGWEPPEDVLAMARAGGA